MKVTIYKMISGALKVGFFYVPPGNYDGGRHSCYGLNLYFFGINIHMPEAKQSN